MNTCTALDDGERCHYYDDTDHEGEMCERCQQWHDKQDRYWRWYFGKRQPDYTESEIRDAYSGLGEQGKRDSLLRQFEG